MIINSKFFHYPPYISTSWKQIASLHMIENTLVITLNKGVSIQISSLSSQEREAIFKAHADFLEIETLTSNANSLTNLTASQTFPSFAQALFTAEPGHDSPFRFGITNMEGLASALQHNQTQANMADLPTEIIQKIASIAKIVAPEETGELPKAEPHCNCMYCQIARAISQGIEENRGKSLFDENQPLDVESSTAKEIWDIHQQSPLIYEVIAKENSLKKYTVYLGEPMGCTCGEEGCVHLIAVLKS